MKKEIQDVANEVQETGPKYVRRPLTQEELVEINSGVKQLKEIGISDNYGKMLSAVPDWYSDDDEVKKINRKNLTDSFGGSDKLKDYLESEEFKSEHMKWNGIARLLPIINNMASYHQRRPSRAGQNVRIQMSIENQLYMVNKNFLESIKDLPREAKIKAILEHDQTTKCEVVELDL